MRAVMEKQNMKEEAGQDDCQYCPRMASFWKPWVQGPGSNLKCDCEMGLWQFVIKCKKEKWESHRDKVSTSPFPQQLELKMSLQDSKVGQDLF